MGQTRRLLTRDANENLTAGLGGGGGGGGVTGVTPLLIKQRALYVPPRRPLSRPLVAESHSSINVCVMLACVCVLVCGVRLNLVE